VGLPRVAINPLLMTIPFKFELYVELLAFSSFTWGEIWGPVAAAHQPFVTDDYSNFNK
jgi:hypothetical protein